MRNKVRLFDQIIAELFANIPASFRGYFVFASTFGTPLTWVGIHIGLVVAFVSDEANAWLATSIIVLLFLPFSGLLKHIIRRRRPQTIYAENMRIKSYSFPSSHAYNAALGGGHIAMLVLISSMPFAFGIAGTIILFSISVGVSRIYLGAHHPSDVLAGWILAVGILISLFSL